MDATTKQSGAANVFAVVLAGGNGERFWPVSTAERPKQFVDLFGGKPLIRHAVDRLDGFIPPERTLVITAERLVPMTRTALPMLPPENIVGEPCRRDTAAAAAVAVGLVKRLGGADAVGCILTADHLIDPVAKFRQTLADTVTAAVQTGSIVTMGIVPEFPATGFGYIEAGDAIDLGTPTVFNRVRRFVEKPDRPTAEAYLSTGRFSWNAGMFIWQVRTLEAEFARLAPDIGGLIDTVATAADVPTTLARLYPALRATSIDYAIMEKAQNILVAKSEFRWDDVGSWQAVANHFPRDNDGNTRLGRTALLDTTDSIVVSDDTHVTAVVGLSDIVVVHTPTATLVCAKDKVQDVKKLVSGLASQPVAPREANA